MNTFIDNVLLFPRVNDSKVNNEKLIQAYQIKHQILSDLTKNNQLSSYRLRDEPKPLASYIKRKRSAVVEKGKTQHLELVRHPTTDFNIKLIQACRKRNSICVSDVVTKVSNPPQVKRSIHNEEDLKERKSLETIRNNLKLKLLKFKTQTNAEDTMDSQASVRHQFKEIFRIRSISKSIKINNAMKYRIQAKKLFKSPSKRQQLTYSPQNEQYKGSKTHQLKVSSLKGWIIDEQDLNLSAYDNDLLPRSDTTDF